MQKYHGVIDAQGPLSEVCLGEALAWSEAQSLFVDVKDMIRVDAPTMSYVSAVVLKVHTNPSIRE